MRAAFSSRSLPGLEIDAKIVRHQKYFVEQPKEYTPSFENNQKTLTAETCASYVPDTIIRSLPLMRRRNELDEMAHANKKVMLVDGSLAELKPVKSRMKARHLRQTPEEDEPVQGRGSIKKVQMRDRMYNEVVDIMHNRIKDSRIRKMPWRLTRIELSPDYRHAVVRWTIDAPPDVELYRQALTDIFAPISTTVRFELARRFSFGFTPTVRFLFEDYTASNLADHLAATEEKDSQSALVDGA